MVAHWMKLIDKYLLRTMLVPFGYCVGSFVLIYIVYDLFDNLSDFVHAGTPFFQVIRFYTFLLPSVFILIVPISILLAVLYGLSQLTKNNELTAMRASGMSLYRLLVPILSIGIVAAIVIITTGWVLIDPLLSGLVALLLFRSAWALTREAGHLLLEGVPASLDRDGIARDLEAHVTTVREVHHMHVWSMDGTKNMATLSPVIVAPPAVP